MALSRYKKTKRAGYVLLPAIFLLFNSISTIRRIVDFPKPPTASISVDSRSSNLTSSFLFSKDDIGFKPTTRLSENKCDPIQGQPPKTVTSFQDYEHLRNLTELTTIRGESDTILAICKFNEHDEGINHFPHVMQHLYMCYTFWQDNPSRVPVLYIKRRHEKERMNQVFSRTPFLRGFMELLTSQLKVRILSHGEIIAWLKENTTKFHVFDFSKENISQTSFTGTSLSSKLQNESHDIGADKEKDNIRDRDDGLNFTFHDMQTPIGYVLSHVDLLNQMSQKH